MKTTQLIPKLFTFIMLLSLIAIIGCNDDEIIKKSSLQAKVNKSLIDCNSVNIQPDSNLSNGSHKGILGQGKEGDTYYYFHLNFPISNGIGTYQIGDNNNEASIEMATPFGNASNNCKYTAISGTIIVSEVTENSYRGTFFFKAKASEWYLIMNVEEGVFEVIL